MKAFPGWHSVAPFEHFPWRRRPSSGINEGPREPNHGS